MVSALRNSGSMNRSRRVRNGLGATVTGPNEVAARTVLEKHKAEGHSKGHGVWRAPRLSRGLDIGRQDMSFAVNPEATGVKGR